MWTITRMDIHNYKYCFTPHTHTQSKHQPICMAGFDMNEDGVPEVITGWSSGKVDVRSSQTGNVIYKDTFSSTVAGIVQVRELVYCTIHVQ